MEQKISITKIQINNYRSCLKSEFNPNKSLTALIGKNAAGKSNLLNSLLFLKKLSNRPHSRQQDVRNANTSTLKITFALGNNEIQYESRIKYNTDERNRDEILDADEKWKFSHLNNIKEWFNLPLSLQRNLDYSTIPKEFLKHKSIQQSLFEYRGRVTVDPFRVFGKMGYNKSFEEIQKIYSIIKKISEFSNGISYYSASQFTDPTRCPPYFEIDAEGALKRVYRPQQEHLQFIYDLYLEYKTSSKNYLEFLSLVGKDGINLIDKIKFNEVKTPSSFLEIKIGGKVTKKQKRTLAVIPSFEIKKIKLSPNQLSEGTFKTLALLFYLITDKSKLLLIEEPEVCIHHGLLVSILEIIKTASLKKQIIISTHSDFILDLLEPSNVFLVQNSLNKGTIIKPVSKSLSSKSYAALKDYLSNSGNLGEYWRHGGLDS